MVLEKVYVTQPNWRLPTEGIGSLRYVNEQFHPNFYAAIIAIYYYWDAYRPRIGPVGNGPNHTLIRTNFLFMLIIGVCFLVIGILMGEF